MQRAPRYPADLKRAVISHAQVHGFAATYEQWPGIEPATIRSWCSRAGVATSDSERTRAAREALALKWTERRIELVDRIGQVAEQALDVTEECLENGETRKASDASAVVARLVDKAQLLSGGATARTEHLQPIPAAEEVLDEIAQRRNAA